MNINDQQITFEEDLSLNTTKVESLIIKLSSSYSFDYDSEFENSHEIFADLYDKENAYRRRFKLFQFPQQVKDISEDFVSNLFINEIKLQTKQEFEQRRAFKEKKKQLFRANTLNKLFDKLTSSNKKKLKRTYTYYRKDFSSVDDNFTIHDESKIYHESEAKFVLPDCEEIEGESLDNSFNQDLTDIMLKTNYNGNNNKHKKILSDNNSGNKSLLNHGQNDKIKKNKHRKNRKNPENNIKGPDDLNIKNSINSKKTKENKTSKKFKRKKKHNNYKDNKDIDKYEERLHYKNKKLKHKNSQKNNSKNNNAADHTRSSGIDSNSSVAHYSSKESYLSNSSSSGYDNCSGSNSNSVEIQSSYYFDKSDKSLGNNNETNKSSQESSNSEYFVEEQRNIIIEKINQECQINDKDDSETIKIKQIKLKEFQAKIDEIEQRKGRRNIDKKAANKKKRKRSKNEKYKINLSSSIESHNQQENHNDNNNATNQHKLKNHLEKISSINSQLSTKSKIVSNKNNSNNTKNLNNTIKIKIKHQIKPTKLLKSEKLKPEKGSFAKEKIKGFTNNEKNAFQIINRKKIQSSNKKRNSNSSSKRHFNNFNTIQIANNKKSSERKSENGRNKIDKGRYKDLGLSDSEKIAKRKYSIHKSKQAEMNRVRPSNRKLGNNLKTIKSTDSDFEEDEQNNTISAVGKHKRGKNINLSNKNFIKTMLFNNQRNSLSSNNSNSFNKNSKRNVKDFGDLIYRPIKKMIPKHDRIVIDDGSPSSKLKLLKRQISLRNRKLLSMKKNSRKNKQDNSIPYPNNTNLSFQHYKSNLKKLLALGNNYNNNTNNNSNGININNSLNQNYDNSNNKKFSNSISAKNNTNYLPTDSNDNKNISHAKADLSNSLISPVASQIKTTVKFSQETDKVIRKIKRFKEKTEALHKNYLDEEKNKIKKIKQNNIINLIISQKSDIVKETIEPIDNNPNINISSTNFSGNFNAIKSKILEDLKLNLSDLNIYDEETFNNIILKYNLPKFSNDLYVIEKIKNCYYQEFQKCKSQQRNTNSTNFNNNINLNEPKEFFESNNKSNSPSRNKARVINTDPTNTNKNEFTSYERKKQLNKKETIECGYPNTLPKLSKNDKELSVQNHGNSKNKIIKNNEDKNSNKDHDSKEQMLTIQANVKTQSFTNSNPNGITNNKVSSIKNLVSKKKADKITDNIDDNFASIVNQIKLMKKQKKIAEQKENTTSITNHIPKAADNVGDNIHVLNTISSLKDSKAENNNHIETKNKSNNNNQKRVISIINDDNHYNINNIANTNTHDKNKIDNESKDDKVGVFKINNEIKNNDHIINNHTAFASNMLISNKISKVENKQKMENEIKEKKKFADEYKKQSFQNMLKLNFQKSLIQNRINFDFDDAFETSSVTVSDKRKQTDSVGTNINFNASFNPNEFQSSKYHLQSDSVRTKIHENFSNTMQKIFSPISTVFDSKKANKNFHTQRNDSYIQKKENNNFEFPKTPNTFNKDNITHSNYVSNEFHYFNKDEKLNVNQYEHSQKQNQANLLKILKHKQKNKLQSNKTINPFEVTLPHITTNQAEENISNKITKSNILNSNYNNSMNTTHSKNPQKLNPIIETSPNPKRLNPLFDKKNESTKAFKDSKYILQNEKPQSFNFSNKTTITNKDEEKPNKTLEIKINFQNNNLDKSLHKKDFIQGVNSLNVANLQLLNNTINYQNANILDNNFANSTNKKVKELKFPNISK